MVPVAPAFDKGVGEPRWPCRRRRARGVPGQHCARRACPQRWRWVLDGIGGGRSGEARRRAPAMSRPLTTARTRPGRLRRPIPRAIVIAIRFISDDPARRRAAKHNGLSFLAALERVNPKRLVTTEVQVKRGRLIRYVFDTDLIRGSYDREGSCLRGEFDDFNRACNGFRDISTHAVPPAFISHLLLPTHSVTIAKRGTALIAHEGSPLLHPSGDRRCRIGSPAPRALPK